VQLNASIKTSAYKLSDRYLKQGYHPLFPYCVMNSYYLFLCLDLEIGTPIFAAPPVCKHTASELLLNKLNAYRRPFHPHIVFVWMKTMSMMKLSTAKYLDIFSPSAEVGRSILWPSCSVFVGATLASRSLCCCCGR